MYGAPIRTRTETHPAAVSGANIKTSAKRSGRKTPTKPGIKKNTPIITAAIRRTKFMSRSSYVAPDLFEDAEGLCSKCQKMEVAGPNQDHI